MCLLMPEGQLDSLCGRTGGRASLNVFFLLSSEVETVKNKRAASEKQAVGPSVCVVVKTATVLIACDIMPCSERKPL